MKRFLVTLIIFLSAQMTAEGQPVGSRHKVYTGDGVGNHVSIDTDSACNGGKTYSDVGTCMQAENDHLDEQIKLKLKEYLESVSLAEISQEDKQNVRLEMQDVQNKWLIYREADCRMREAFLGGALDGQFDYLDCIRQHSRMRLLDFQRH